MDVGAQIAQEARVLLAKLPDEDTAIVVAAVDRSIWEHGTDEPWDEIKNEWPDEYEWREVWVRLDSSSLVAPFEAVVVEGEVE